MHIRKQNAYTHMMELNTMQIHCIILHYTTYIHGYMHTYRASELLGSRPSARFKVHLSDAQDYIHKHSYELRQSTAAVQLYDIVMVDIDSGVEAPHTGSLAGEKGGKRPVLRAQTCETTSLGEPNCMNTGETDGSGHDLCEGDEDNRAFEDVLMSPPEWVLQENFMKALVQSLSEQSVGVYFCDPCVYVSSLCECCVYFLMYVCVCVSHLLGVDVLGVCMRMFICHHLCNISVCVCA